VGTGVIGLSVGDGLGTADGLGVGTTGFTGADLVVPRRVLFFDGFAGPVTSAGDGPASAGLATSVAVGVTGCGRRVRLLATARAGVNEHG
jgi:hypothetical protein